jgi:hypothetical protein
MGHLKTNFVKKKGGGTTGGAGNFGIFGFCSLPIPIRAPSGIYGFYPGKGAGKGPACPS